ncbi:ABC transporter ATP-binding protein [Dictyobacter sp. S3.2.2.5]|uniref:ABC transporter ATP-binding protein n=1 Tax=Dictyobacter halimunensis TaxID=3026934 RepID=A0ABQ6G0K9_9CHLR|nr:ABC transporter ATP-binding protein [Dictyobacter sp. S3.2.2.5]
MEEIRQQSANSQEREEQSVVRARGVSKAYKTPQGRIDVLRRVDLSARLGEFVAITGPSGSGKTTLLTLLGALDAPDSGEIWLDEVAVHQLRGVAAADFRRTKVGFVFQLFYLLPGMSALENVMAPLLPYRKKLDFDLKQRARDLLEQVGLGERTGHVPARMSGGEQQRVAIARALINRPPVLLADEPTGNLDPATGNEILQVLQDLRERYNQTLIMVTHDQDIATRADRRIELGQTTSHAR